MATFPAKTTYVTGDVYTATDVNDYGLLINELYNQSPNALVTTKGDLLVGSTSGVVVRKAVGANNTILYADSAATGGVAWGSVTGAMVASETITSSNILNATITGTDIASGTITSTNILDATITGTDIASGTITSANILDATIVAGDIANATLTGAKIADEAFTSYSPISSGLTVGTGGTASGRQFKTGNIVHFHIDIEIGTSGFSVSTPPILKTPTASFAAGGSGVGSWQHGYVVRYYDTSTGNWYVGVSRLQTGGADLFALMYVLDFGGVLQANVSSTAPFTWAAGDRIMVSGWYEEA